MKKLPITDEDMEALQAIMQKEGLSMNATIHYLITGHKGNTKIRRAKFFFPATLKIEEKALDLFKKDGSHHYLMDWFFVCYTIGLHTNTGLSQKGLGLLFLINYLTTKANGNISAK